MNIKKFFCCLTGRFRQHKKHIRRKPKKQPVSVNFIRARLTEQGSNFRQFALRSGYNPRTVTQVIDRWVPRAELPRGRLSYRILRDLSRSIEHDVVPGILKSDE